ncbi:CD59 glycoprotein [Mixophyes fleayi]|uniref:CD59 glycoprotein n=1 Tax=Mixophyes fleayi TaxID=3061075 RepID=UPI003F4DFAD3
MQTTSIISVLIIFLRCHIGYSLECYSCLNDCTEMATVTKTCGPEMQCVIMELWRNERLQNRQKDCLNSQDCNTTLTGDMLRWCCNTDRCNMAMPRTTPLSTSGPITTNTEITAPSTPMKCRKCDTTCLIKSETTCNLHEVCMKKTSSFAGFDIDIRGCTNTTACFKVSSETHVGTDMSFKTDCCNTDMCNSASPLSVPAVAALATIVALWISKLN